MTRKLKTKLICVSLLLIASMLLTGCTSHLQAIGAEGKDGSGLDAYLAAAKTYASCIGKDEDTVKKELSINDGQFFGSFDKKTGVTYASYTAKSPILKVMGLDMYPVILVDQSFGMDYFSCYCNIQDKIKESDTETIYALRDALTKLYGEPAQDQLNDMPTADEIRGTENNYSYETVWNAEKGAEPLLCGQSGMTVTLMVMINNQNSENAHVTLRINHQAEHD